MTWNYRVVVEKDVTGDDVYSIREVYYAKRGEIRGWTDPVTLSGFESIKDLLGDLTLMESDALPSMLRRISPRSLLRLRTKRTGKQVLEEVWGEPIT